jgi:VanZ family protein
MLGGRAAYCQHLATHRATARSRSTAAPGYNRTVPPSRLARFGPPILWMAVIALLSGGVFGGDETGAWLLPVLRGLLPAAGPATLHGAHAALRKLAHVTEYGILAALWVRALEARPRAAVWAVGLSALYAVLDEARQGLAPNRSPAVTDVLIDVAGALVAVACLRPRDGLAWIGLRIVRWAAGTVAIASVAAVILEWSLGLAAWDLAGAAVLATATAAGLRRLERAWRPSA